MDPCDLSTLKLEASDENTSPQRLQELTQISPELARQVAQNPSAPPELLRELGRSTKECSIRAFVAANPNTPKEVLLRLAIHFPEQFLNNPVVPLLCLEPDFLATLPLDTARSLFQCEKVPTVWLKQVSIKIRKTLAKDSSTPITILEKLASDRDRSVRERVAKNPQTPTAVLPRLAWDIEYVERERLEEFWTY